MASNGGNGESADGKAGESVATKSAFHSGIIAENVRDDSKGRRRGFFLQSRGESATIGE